VPGGHEFVIVDAETATETPGLRPRAARGGAREGDRREADRRCGCPSTASPSPRTSARSR
jgi:hypothetical protein